MVRSGLAWSHVQPCPRIKFQVQHAKVFSLAGVAADVCDVLPRLSIPCTLGQLAMDWYWRLGIAGDLLIFFLAMRFVFAAF
jgi:hypothetical protein